MFSFQSSSFFPALTLDSLRQSIPTFDNIYQGHLQSAKFDVVKAANFKSLKGRLIFVHRLLKERQELASETRADLIQALFSGDLRRAKQISSNSDKPQGAGKGSLFKFLPVTGLVSKGIQKYSLQREMKELAEGVSDSDFLLNIKGISDEDLRIPIQEAEELAHTQLSSSIDTTVGKVTRAMLAQQAAYKQSIRREVEANERKALSRILVNFIQDINKCSVGQSDS